MLYRAVSSSFHIKYKSPGSWVRRINVKPVDGFDESHAVVKSKMNESELKGLSSDASEFAISYIDDEGDTVAITNDQDLIDCVLISKNSNLDKADIFVHNSTEELDLTEYHLKKEQLKQTQRTTGSSHDGPAQLVPGVENIVLIGGARSAGLV